ncbi:hypothetical protein COB28_01885 [Candidatus Dependentiae bacterium]|nr:MAG: hypothetical protein COB28_01885 [Candidatus Dependentiae bacterium]
MSTIFSLEIIYQTSSKKMDVLQIDVTSVTGGFLIGPHSSSLISILGKNSKLHLTLPTEDLSTITIPAGILTINRKGNVSILTINPEIMYAFENCEE